MSLIDRKMTACVLMTETAASDDRGGSHIQWTDSEEFRAAIAQAGGTERLIAQAKGWDGLYDVLTRKDVNLQYHDVFRREEDGKVFRVKSDGDDNKTPENAMDLRKVEAEEWSLPTEGSNDG